MAEEKVMEEKLRRRESSIKDDHKNTVKINSSSPCSLLFALGHTLPPLHADALYG